MLNKVTSLSLKLIFFTFFFLTAQIPAESGNAIVSREARSAISKAASSFILCVTSMASAHCEAGKRKTLAASDVIGALRDMQFGHFESPLLEYLESKLAYT